MALGDDWLAPVLPSHKTLSEAQLGEVRSHVDVLERAAQSGPVDRIGAAIAGMLSAFPSQQLGDAEQMARAGMYRAALEDVPAWAVDRAVKFWMRREHSEGRENYAFAPSPPQLRRLAVIACGPVRGELQKLRRLLSAKVERNLTHEQRAANVERLKSIVGGKAS